MINFKKIFDSIRTEGEAKKFIEELDNLEDSIYKVKNNLAENLEKLISQPRNSLLLLSLEENNIDLKNPIALENFIKDLRQEVKNLKTVDITLAFEPDTSLVERMSDWLLLNSKSKPVLRISVKKEIIGGAIVASNGKYNDFSLKKILNEVTANPQNQPVS